MKILLVLSVLLSPITIYAQPKANLSPKTLHQFRGRPEWNVKMNEMARTITQLVPYLFSKSRFESRRNRQLLLRRVRELNSLAHSIDQMQPSKNHVQSTDPDPAIRYFSHLFKQQVASGYQSLRLGYLTYSRSALQTSISYCISCHTLSNIGPQFSGGWFTRNLRQLSPLERMSLLTATRRFDAAMEEFSKNVLHRRAELSAAQMERATRIALAISVRVKKSPSSALLLIKQVKRSRHLTSAFRRDLHYWSQDLEKWQKERAFSRKSAKTKPSQTEEQLLKRARLLVHQAQKMQHYPADARADVEYLRASSLLHTILDGQPDPNHLAEELYLTGLCYDSLRDLGFWSLHEMYYQECILKAPHSQIAQKCFQRYRRSIVEGFSGSSGIRIPPDVKRKLSRLKSIAQVLKIEQSK